MPLYDFRCEVCGARRTDVFIKLEEFDEKIHSQTCHCGMDMVQEITFTVPHKGFEPKFEPCLGEVVTSHWDRNKKMAKKGLQYVDPKKDWDFQTREI